MSEQRGAGGVVPENQVVGDKTDSSVTNQNPPRPGQDDFTDGRSETNVAGQGAGQVTEKDRARLEGQG